VGRVYVVSGENLTLGTGNVLAAIQPTASGAGSLLRILRAEVSQSGTATAAQVRVACGSRTTATTLTMTSATPNPIVLGGAASAITGGTAPTTAGKAGVNSSADSGGTYVDTWPMNPNNLGGASLIFTPAENILVPPAILFVVRFLAAPGTTTGWTVVVVYEEVI
jgi:hypothetical protein